MQKVDPTGDFEVESVPLDQPREAIWGSIGAWDLVHGHIINYRRKWVWADEVTQELPKVKVDESIDRFIWFTLATTDETDMIRFTKPYRKYVLQGQISTNRVVVSL